MVDGLKQQRLHRVGVRAHVYVSGTEMTCPCVNHWGGLGVLKCKSGVRVRGVRNFSIALPFNNSVLPTIQTSHSSIKGLKMNQLAEVQCHREGFMEKIKCGLRGHRGMMCGFVMAR